MTMRIVLVEDSRDLLDSICEYLQLDGHEVEGYTTARALLDAPDRLARADVIITDYYLPEVNGLELAWRLRSLGLHVPVVLLTGARDVSLRERLASMERVHFLPKPVSPAVLQDLLLQIARTADTARPRSDNHDSHDAAVHGS